MRILSLLALILLTVPYGSAQDLGLKNRKSVDALLERLTDSSKVVQRFGKEFVATYYTRTIKGGSTQDAHYPMLKLSYIEGGMNFHFDVRKQKCTTLNCLVLDSNYSTPIYGFITLGQTTFDEVYQEYYRTISYGREWRVGWAEEIYTDTTRQFALYLGSAVHYTKIYPQTFYNDNNFSYGREVDFFENILVNEIKLFLFKHPDNHIFTDYHEAIIKPKETRNLSLHAITLVGIPDEIFELSNLETLDLSSNKIDSIGKRFGNFKELRSLNLGNNELKEVPAELSKLRKLQWLSLSENQIKEFPIALKKLNSLTRLSLDENPIEKIPEFVLELKNIKVLSLREIGIKTIPTEFGNLTGLVQLNLCDNELDSLPSCIRNLTSMSTLYLRNTGITKLPDWIVELKDLHEVYLKGCKFSIEERKRLKTLLPNNCRVQWI
ncbi:MAG: Leucine-rich repeat (LRR) protein [Crocinitomicaceae bacterium]|jgi:Leucine-rich repeat (LRR) protein